MEAMLKLNMLLLPYRTLEPYKYIIQVAQVLGVLHRGVGDNGLRTIRI
jgi:hypothetical protein